MNALLGYIAILIIIGAGWRYVNPLGVSSANLQRALLAILHTVLLPVLVLIACWQLKLNTNAFNILAIAAIATGLTFTGAWFWYRKMSGLPSSAQNPLILAAVFGNVFFLGIPATTMIYGDWTAKYVIEFALVANILIAFTAGYLLLSKEGRETKNPWPMFQKEPIAWAAVAGLLLNITSVAMPRWLSGWSPDILTATTVLMLVTVGLNLHWNKEWNHLIPKILPAAVLQLIITPLLFIGIMKFVGPVGVKTGKALVLSAAMPSMALGFIYCERFGLSTKTYSVAFSMIGFAAIVTVPIWYRMM